MKIQRLGEKSWIVIADAPEQIWPLIKQFLADNGIDIGREDSSGGVIESAWIVVTDQDYDDVVRTAVREGMRKHRDGEESSANSIPPGRDRMLFRIERGIRRNSTEVHVDHQRALGTGDEIAPPVAEVQAEVVAKLAEYFAHGVVGTSVSLVGRDVAAEDKAQLIKDESGYPSMRLNVGFDRAWATIGQALERAEIPVLAADRETAAYQATFPTAGRRGWLKRIVPGGEDGRDTPVTIRIERTENADDSVVVRVGTPDGEPLAAELAEDVLLTLREFAA